MSLFDGGWENELYLWTGWITIQGERGGGEGEREGGGREKERGGKEIYNRQTLKLHRPPGRAKAFMFQNTLFPVTCRQYKIKNKKFINHKYPDIPYNLILSLLLASYNL